jgi:toxin-antitoxin system PIN domain toxin
MSEPARPWRFAEPSPPWPLLAGDLPDLNVWLALSHRGHPFHGAANAYWQSVCAQDTALWFCRPTMMGLVRLLSQPAVMGPEVLPLDQAFAVYQRWLAVPQVRLLAEPSGVDSQLQAMLAAQTEPLPARLWTDLCLAALADAAGLRLVSFDRDFERLGTERLHLLAR